jgi:hypothetical protein
MGVALPQPGPEGTMMMFSVEYQVARLPPGVKELVWVIERAQGGPARIKFPPGMKSPLNTALMGWRPEHGPFRSHIEDAKGRRLSASIDMQ